MDHEDIPAGSAFYNAVLHLDNKRLSELLDQGEFIDVLDKYGNTALHLATSLGNTDAVDLLLEHHSDVNLQNELGETPLHIAIKKRNEALVGKFLNRGADCYSQDKRGNSALSLAVINNFEPAIDLLSEQNLDIESYNTDGYTCYHLLVLQKNAVLLEKIISKKKYVTSFIDYKGRTPLHMAIVGNFQRGFELLLEGSYHYAQDHDGYTVLHLAVIHRNCTIIKQLINVMSELYTNDNKNRSALDLAILHNLQFAICSFLRKGIDNSDRNSNPLHMAVLKKNKTLIRELLIDGSEIDAKDSKGRTPLHWAIMRCFSGGIKILLSKGADVNATDDYGKSALHYSVLGKCVGLMERLVDRGADINYQNIYGMSSIHLAVMGSFQAGLNFLLTKGADVSIRDSNRNTVLHNAVLSRQSNINNMIEILLMHEGVDQDAQNTNNDTALNLAVKEGLESIAVLLLDKGVNVNINLQNESSFSPLHTAICQDKDKRKTKVIKKLCEIGADIEIRTSSSETPLHLAAYQKYTQAVRLLLEKGALVNEVGSEGNTALHFSVIQPSDQEESRLIVDLLLNNEADLTIRNRQGQTVIHTASSSGFASIVNLLIERGADVHELDNSQSSALHKAVSSKLKNKMLVEHLISLGLDINIKDAYGKSPLQLAVENSFGEAVKLLLENGANVNETDNNDQLILPLASSLPTRSILESLLNFGMDINQKNKTGTALHSAVVDKRYQNVKLLLKYKINVNDVNSDGDTAFHKAFSYFNKPNMTDIGIIKLLIENGADINAKKICGRTILHMNTNLTMVKLLLNNNAKMSEQDNEGNTPLHYAISRKNVEIVNLLVESGANLYLKNNNGRSILHLAVKRHLISCLHLILKNYLEINAQDIKGNTCLHYAASHRYLNILKMLLLNKNIDVSIKNKDKVTATCLAALKCFQSGVRLLLERETQVSESKVCKEEALLLAVLKGNIRLTKQHIRRNIDINYKKSRSALHLAVIRNFQPAVELLVESGANVNDTDVNGNTPLQLAAFVRNPRIMNILLSNGANLHSRNENNRTAIHLASLTNFSEGVELLLDQGAVLNQQDCDGNTPLHLAFNNIDSALVLINNGARMDITNQHNNSFSSMRLKSEMTFWKIETLLFKLKIAFPENTQSDFSAHRNYSEDNFPSETELKEEVRKMKSHRFCGKSLLDMLAFHKDPRFVLIDQLKTLMDLTSLEDDFPNYGSMLKARLKRSERRNDLVSVASTLPICTENCNKSLIVLPTEIKRKIMSELSSEELVSVLEAFI